MDQLTVKAFHQFDRCLAGDNPLAPELMTLDELAAILAAGVVRLRRQQQSEPRLSEKDNLDFPAGRSVHATSRKQRRVTK